MMKLLAFIIAFVGLVASGLSANAQSNPSPQFSYGSVPTAGQWNSFFRAKQDYLGYTPFSSNGGSLNGELLTLPSTALMSGLNIGIGIAPTTPYPGDMWMTSAGLYFQTASGTIGPVFATTFAGVVSVDNYGAVGNGTTDDTIAFSNALAACATAGGGQVLVGPKRYKVSSTLVVPFNCSMEGLSHTIPYGAYSTTPETNQPYTILSSASPAVQCGPGSSPDQTCAVRGLFILNSALPNPTSIAQAVTNIANFAGTGILIPHTSQGAIIENVSIGGFNLGLDSETDNALINNVTIDSTNCFLTNENTNYSLANFVQCIPFMTNGVTGADSQFTTTAVANDGSGHVQLTVNNTASVGGISTSSLANGYTVYVSTLVGRPDVYGAYTISNLSIGGSTTTFSLVGSSYGATATTGVVTSGSNYVTGLASSTNLGYIAPGTILTDAGSCIPASDTVLWVNLDTSELYLTNPATCSSSGSEVVTSTPGSYASGGLVDFNLFYRSGYGFKVGDSTATYFSNTFDFGHHQQYLIEPVSTSTIWPTFVAAGCDGSPYGNDPTRICIDIEGNAGMAQFIGGTFLDAGIQIKVATSGQYSGAVYRNIFNDMTVYNNIYLGAEILSGGVVFGGGVAFRSYQPNFIGDNAVVQSLASNNQTNTQTIYQSAADTANVSFPMVGNFSATGNISAGGTIGTGGNAPPASGMEIVGAASTFGYRVDDGSPASQNYSAIEPTFWRFNRGSGSSVGLEIETTNSGSWGSSSGAGSIWLNPNGGASNGLACFTDGRCNMELGISSFPGATFEIGGTLRLSGGTPTIASNACGSATQGTITAGGTDETGQVNVGTSSVTSCTVSFSATLPSAPRACQLTPANSSAAAWATTGAYVSAITSAHFVITGANLSGASYYYTCM